MQAWRLGPPCASSLNLHLIPCFTCTGESHLPVLSLDGLAHALAVSTESLCGRRRTSS